MRNQRRLHQPSRELKARIYAPGAVFGEREALKAQINPFTTKKALKARKLFHQFSEKSPEETNSAL